jgi:hypothetical protein
LTAMFPSAHSSVAKAQARNLDLDSIQWMGDK